jgi:hypothetical protein
MTRKRLSMQIGFRYYFCYRQCGDVFSASTPAIVNPLSPAATGGGWLLALIATGLRKQI